MNLNNSLGLRVGETSAKSGSWKRDGDLYTWNGMTKFPLYSVRGDLGVHLGAETG